MRASLRIASALALVVGLVFPLGAGAQVPELTYTVVRSWSTLYDTSVLPNPAYGPVNSPDGIAWDGSGLWVTQCGGENFARFDETGNFLEAFSLPGGEFADHLAWDGTYMWANLHSHPDDPRASDPTASPTGRLIQIDIASHEIVRTIEIPWADWRMAPMGLGWDGQRLWTNSHMDKELFSIDPDTLEGLETPAFMNPVNPFNPPDRVRACGNAFDGQSCLWVSDLSTGVYFQVDTTTGEIASYLRPPDNPDPTRYGSFRPPEVRKLFTGMTTDGEDRVWIMDEIEGNPLVYEINVDFPTTGPCAHPVALGEACVPGGEPFCRTGAVCAGEAGAETCQEETPDAGVSPDGGTFSDAGPGTTPTPSGCSCSMWAAPSGTGAAGLAVGFAGLFLLLFSRKRR